MKRAASREVLASAATFFVMASIALSEPLTTTIVTPEELKWVKIPLAMRAVIAGDDKERGKYIFRANFPANFRAQPHYHPDEKMNMVISNIARGLRRGVRRKQNEGAARRQHLDGARKSAAFRVGEGRRSRHSSCW